ncbi:YhgE/Pip domain-containing protein [Rossellomorea vietnamensis]|uniref:YhgE/Pip domain-containing protein n=2 Tax=Rossellomorea vietnamensis TaxID=218284 RepID=A0A5D4NWC1_9BACI|nr:YhgE/Pip domain-containing protein [Rossellomorea vietnamensis]
MMMRKKQIRYTALAAMVFLPSFLSQPALAATEGNVASKDEVIYATLNASGNLDNIYVVNTLEVEKAGEILDYGKYSSVKNLTDLAEINQEGQKIEMEAPEGKFYYQGNMDKETELPWNVNVSYQLDGKKVKAEELAGKHGHLEISVEITENEKGDAAFYENYLLQVSLAMPNTYQDIEAPDGMVANAGKNKQITFTVMPGEEETLSVEANVENFEFSGVEIAAVPSTLPIDASGTGSMTEDMSELSSGIKKLNDGVGELETGIAELHNGSAGLQDGSAQYKNGISEVNGYSAGLVNGSASIRDALADINQSLSGQSADMDLSSLSELPAGLKGLAGGLTEVSAGLTALQENYAGAYAALAGAINEIPAGQVSEEQIAALYESGADTAVVDQLAASYAAAQKVKAVYGQVQEAFAAVEPALTELSGSVSTISGQLTKTADSISASLQETDMSGLAELQKGIASLSAEYGEFHSGLAGYTNGVGNLASSYSELHSGIVDLTGGTSELQNGVGDLHDGTAELYKETKDLPAQMQEEIDKMISEYDKSDFEPVSFVSSENENVSSVQFVIKTQSIELEEQEEKKAEPEKEKGFWELFMDLFK